MLQDTALVSGLLCIRVEMRERNRFPGEAGESGDSVVKVSFRWIYQGS